MENYDPLTLYQWDDFLHTSLNTEENPDINVNRDIPQLKQSENEYWLLP